MNLLIVESPSKAKTIEKYLGNGWRVVASVGHVRDLVPESGSVDTEHDFKPKWQIMPGKEKQIKLITDELKKADNVYLASDPDREGEAIAWHINDILNARKVLSGKKVYRVAFHEITKNAIMEAIKNPREIDNNLVDAYLVRRILDYLIGFGISLVAPFILYIIPSLIRKCALLGNGTRSKHFLYIISKILQVIF